MLARLIESTGGRKFTIAILSLIAAVSLNASGIPISDNLLILLLGITTGYGAVNVGKAFVDNSKKDLQMHGKRSTLVNESSGGDLASQVALNKEAIGVLDQAVTQLYRVQGVSIGSNQNVPTGQQSQASGDYS